VASRVVRHPLFGEILLWRRKHTWRPSTWRAT